MAEVTDVTIVGGLPTAGSGTVPTLSKTNTVIGAVDETAPATDTASSGTNGRLQRIAQRLTSLIALVPASLGSKAAASAFAVTDSTEDIARMGIITETAPASDTASSGLNGRLQRIAQNISTVFGATALDLGSGTGGTRTLRVRIDSAQVAPAASTYETVAASQTAQVLGPGSGASGDYISGVLVIPGTTSPGNVLLLDSATSITIFTGGAASVSNLVPFFIPLGMVSQSGAWKLTTGSNVSCIGVGTFT